MTRKLVHCYYGSKREHLALNVNIDTQYRAMLIQFHLYKFYKNRVLFLCVCFARQSLFYCQCCFFFGCKNRAERETRVYSVLTRMMLLVRNGLIIYYTHVCINGLVTKINYNPALIIKNKQVYKWNSEIQNDKYILFDK